MEAGLLCLMLCQPHGPWLLGLAWGWEGEAREDTARPHNTKQGLPHEQGLQLPSHWPGTYPAIPFTAHFYGAFCSLEGNVPCAYKYTRVIYARGQGLPGPRTPLLCGQIHGAVAEFLPSSTWHSVNVTNMLFRQLGKNCFPFIQTVEKKFLKNPPWYGGQFCLEVEQLRSGPEKYCHILVSTGLRSLNRKGWVRPERSTPNWD